MELFDLDRFIQAQDNFNTYETALQEVKEGEKRSHWIWYIFPQIDGMGHSSTSQYYAIKSLLEAKAYWENDYLRDHLYEITKALLKQNGSASDIFGGLDAMKVRSCMTLFNIVSPDDVFTEVLEKFYDNTVCQHTLEIVEKELASYEGDSAFERNGIHTRKKAFFESGSYESNQYSHEQKMATMLDLVSRGETMLAMVQRYFWEKDMSHYRVSGVESTIGYYLSSLIDELCESLNDKTLVKEVYDFLDAIPFSESNVFTWANSYDDFYKKFHQNNEIKAAFETLQKDSLCKPLEKKPVARMYNDVERSEYTPSKLCTLKNDEVFVFGSNLAGHHAGGAARAAVNHFGAVWGQGVGLQGQSYAIPTMQGGVETIKPYVDDFIAFACQHPELFFYVTRIGCGIAGFRDEDIAPLFADAIGVDNICLPRSFVEILKSPVGGINLLVNCY